MLSKADNELICRVGRGAPMGEAMRRHWIPVATSDEVQAGGDPVGVEVLGEQFVAFRDGQGRPGLVNEACCHRQASLALGRVEDCGIRCIYHGWLFAADGEVLETPNVQDQQFRTRIRQPAYPVKESGGMIWAYLGPDASPPPFPRFPWADFPDGKCQTFVHLADGNYVQVMEGLLDSTHLGVLHSSNIRKMMQGKAPKPVGADLFMQDLMPAFESEDTAYGFRYAALRSVPDEGGEMKRVVRVTAWVAPFTVFNASGDFASIIVPVSDEVSAFFHIYWGPGRDLEAFGHDEAALRRYYLTRDLYRSPDRPNRANRWLQDRASMRAKESFSGFAGLTADDVAVTSSPGAIRDRTIEHLAPSDLGVAMLYRRLKDLATAPAAALAMDPRRLPPIADGVAFQADLPSGTDWRALGVREPVEA